VSAAAFSLIEKLNLQCNYEISGLDCVTSYHFRKSRNRTNSSRQPEHHLQAPVCIKKI
jgi:hypothetical protein